MRSKTMWLAVVLSCLAFTPAHAAWCVQFYAVDMVECNSGRLTSLRDKIQQKYDEALKELRGAKRAALENEQNSWLANRHNKCEMYTLEWVTEARIRQVRPCLVELYEARIAHLSQIVSSNSSESKSGSNEVENTGEKKGTEIEGVQHLPDLADGKWESELDTRMKYWETRLPFCTFAGGGAIPREGSGKWYSVQ